jgi:hypothetical protein
MMTLLNFRLAEIGIALVVACGFLALIFCLNFFAIALVNVVGLVLYIFGRKTFLNRIKDASAFLVFLSFIPLVEAGFFALYAALYTIGSSPSNVYLTWEESVQLILGVSLFFLKIISGMLLFADGIQFKFDRFAPLTLEQKIDLSQTKYPEDLLAKYVKRYPHNPSGVLEWHIHKKMKEGKTREQAIKELQE